MFSLNPTSESFLSTIELLLKIIGAVGALILFCIGYRRYRKDQVWKRNEFVAKEMKDFGSDVCSKNAMYMLDWGVRTIQLFPDKDSYEEKFVLVNREMLEAALQIHTMRDEMGNGALFNEVEVAIRDSFDKFLSYFERFYHYLETGLMTKEEIQPYLSYWIGTIADDLEDNIKAALYSFIHEYKYVGTQKFFQLFERDIRPFTSPTI